MGVCWVNVLFREVNQPVICVPVNEEFLYKSSLSPQYSSTHTGQTVRTIELLVIPYTNPKPLPGSSLNTPLYLYTNIPQHTPLLFTPPYPVLYRSHEWLKHGTCASQIQCMNSENGFFSTVLHLHRTKMDISAVLSSHDIFPSHNHTFKVTHTHTLCIFGVN